MKNFNLTLFLIITFSTFSYSQFQKGTWTINPNTGALFVYANGNSAFASATEFGYFLSGNLLTGINLQYLQTDDASQIGLNPYIRYYFTPRKSIKLFGQVTPALSTQFNDSYSNNLTVFSPKLTLGFNYLLQKNVGLELGFDINSYHFARQKSPDMIISRSFTDLYVSPQLGMRLFLNTASGVSYPSKDYLKKGNFTFGTYGSLLSRPKNNVLFYNFLLNFDFFLADFLSIGTAIQLSPASIYAGYGNEAVFTFTPSIQHYRPIAPTENLQFVSYAGLELNPYNDYTAYHLGFKLNGFIGENTSLWAGPSVFRVKGVNGWFFNAGIGVNYFIVSKKNRWK